MTPRRFDPASLVAGLALAGLGALEWLDARGSLELTPGWAGAAGLAALGVCLLALGLTGPRK